MMRNGINSDSSEDFGVICSPLNPPFKFMPVKKGADLQ